MRARQYTGALNQPALTNSRRPGELLTSLNNLIWGDMWDDSPLGSGCARLALQDVRAIRNYQVLPDPKPKRRKARRT